MVRVIGDVEVLAGVTLAIAAGVRVEFAGHHALHVQGRLLAVGTAAAPILFTPGDRGSGWNGLRFERTPATSGGSRLEHCVVEGARAVRGGVGVGPLVCEGVGELEVVDTVVRDNVADHGGALFCLHGAAPRLVGCLLTGNRADLGGGAVFCVDGFPRLIACTVAGNRDANPEPMAEAAALLTYYGKPRITASIFWDNPTGYFLPAPLWQAKAFCTTWSDIEGGHAGEGNLAEPPAFLAAGPHPFALAPSSPCLDAGPPDVDDLALPPVDLAGRPRVQGGRLDLGAYEGAVPTAVGAAPAVAASLEPPVPNPANPRAEVAFTITAAGSARLCAYDLRGRRLATLAEGRFAPGRHRAAWDASGVPSGSYLLVLEASGRREVRRLAVLR